MTVVGTDKKMPKKNNSGFIARSKSTARKPFRDVSNAVKTSSKSTTTAKKLPVKCDFEEEDDEQQQQLQVGDDNGGVLDRLLLVHSDISNLLHRVI